MKNAVLTNYREKLVLEVIVIKTMGQRAWVNEFLARFRLAPNFGLTPSNAKV